MFVLKHPTKNIYLRIFSGGVRLEPLERATIFNDPRNVTYRTAVLVRRDLAMEIKEFFKISVNIQLNENTNEHPEIGHSV